MDEQKGKNRRAIIQVSGLIIVAIISAVSSYFVGKNASEKEIIILKDKDHNVVPQTAPTSTKELPPSNSKDNYSVLKDISIFDLRFWKETPDSLIQKKRFSPVNYINYLHIKKLKDVKSFTAHYATTGFAIDMRCITHKATIFRQEKSGSHNGQTRYAVEVDISEIPLNEEFLIVIEATYWNSYNNLLTESSSTYTDEEIDGLKELSLIIFLPESKPFKSYKLKRAIGHAKEEIVTHNIGSLYPDESNYFIYWSIGKITADTHYTLQWNW